MSFSCLVSKPANHFFLLRKPSLFYLTAAKKNELVGKQQLSTINHDIVVPGGIIERVPSSLAPPACSADDISCLSFLKQWRCPSAHRQQRFTFHRTTALPPSERSIKSLPTPDVLLAQLPNLSTPNEQSTTKLYFRDDE